MFHGVAVVIRNEIRNYVVNVHAQDARLMHLVLRGTINLSFISAYAPTAGADKEVKDQF